MMEDVWSFPRPAVLQPCPRSIRVAFGGRLIAATTSAYRVIETSHPPVYYLPRAAFRDCLITPAPGQSFCEWKGLARYWSIEAGDRKAEHVAWSYAEPTVLFAPLRDHLALYAEPMDGCFIDGERVTPQPGGFYGGWITDDLTGPFKGVPGSQGW